MDWYRVLSWLLINAKTCVLSSSVTSSECFFNYIVRHKDKKKEKLKHKKEDLLKFYGLCRKLKPFVVSTPTAQQL